MEEQLEAIFEARNETYREFTQQIVDLLPEVSEAIYKALDQKSRLIAQGCQPRLSDVTIMFGRTLAFSVILEFPLGTFNMDGDTIEVTEQNQGMFKYGLYYVYDLDVVFRRDVDELVAATIKQMDASTEEAKAKAKAKSESPNHDFDLSELTDEQKKAYLLHLRGNQT